MSHNASALAQESATRIPKWKDLGSLRLPCPGTDEPMATCTVQGVRRGDERGDNSCWVKLRVPTPHESEEGWLPVSFCFLGVFRFFLVTAITSVEGTFHCVFFFLGTLWPGKAPVEEVSLSSNRYQGSVYGHTLLPSVHSSEPGVGIRSCPAF